MRIPQSEVRVPELPRTSAPLHHTVWRGATMSRGSRCYMVTVFAPEGKDLLLLDPTLWPKCTFFVYQREVCPKTSREHFQCYLELDSCVRFTTLMNECDGLDNPGFTTFLPRRGTQTHAIAYCTKPDPWKGYDAFRDDTSRVEGPWFFGTPKAQGQRSDLLEIQRDLKAGLSLKRLAEAHFPEWVRFGKSFKEYKRIISPARDFKTIVILIVGPSGVGKSRFAAQLNKYLMLDGRCDELTFPELGYHPEFNPVIRGIKLSPDDPQAYKLPDKHTGMWCDDYDSEPVFFMEEFGGHRCTPTFFNELADRYECVVPAHGSAGHQMVSKYLVICSNYAPKFWWKNRNANQQLQTTRRIDVLIKMIPKKDYRPSVVYDPLLQQFIHQ